MRQRPATTPHPAPEQPPPVAPATVEISPHRLHMADAYTATFAVCGYPATVTDAWLEPLLSWPGRLDLAVHIEPIPPEAAARLLRIQRTRLEAGRRYHADQGRLDDPSLDVAAGDAADLAHGVARAATRLFATGIYLTVHAASRDELSEACAQIRAAAAGLLLDVQPATWRHLPGWRTTLPLGVDELGQTRVLDTDALAAALPHASPDLPAPPPGAGVTATAVLYGLNLATGSPVWWDRWACDNHNSILVARSGAGKSYLTKLDLLRNLYHGVHAAVVDPEDEYTHLAEAAGGTVVRLGAPGVHLNPLDLPAPDTRPDALQRRALFVQTFIETLTGAGMDPYQQAALVQAITAAYADAGISDDPATWQRPAPLLADVAARLSETATALAARLVRRHSACRCS